MITFLNQPDVSRWELHFNDEDSNLYCKIYDTYTKSYVAEKKYIQYRRRSPKEETEWKHCLGATIHNPDLFGSKGIFIPTHIDLRDFQLNFRSSLSHVLFNKATLADIAVLMRQAKKEIRSRTKDRGWYTWDPFELADYPPYADIRQAYFLILAFLCSVGLTGIITFLASFLG